MSQPNPPTRSYRPPGGRKKTSIPTLKFHSMEDSEDATQRLETAVRKISRGSPNPQRPPTVCHVGLDGLARGYEQYRESLTCFRLTTEFGEASSDDLSSEWESSSSDVEHNNNSIVQRPMTPLLENTTTSNDLGSRTTSEELQKKAMLAVETANNQLAMSKLKHLEAKVGVVLEADKESVKEEESKATETAKRPPPPLPIPGPRPLPGSESPPPRKLVLPPPSAQRADQPKRVRGEAAAGGDGTIKYFFAADS
jgi:hypothetical protein